MNTQQKDYIRKDRSVSPDVRQKISQSLRGRSKSFNHRQNISNGVKKYWEQIPKSNNDDGITTMDDILS
jgi:hypothetical protein